MFGVFSVLICHSHYEVNDPNWNICRSWTVVESPETHPCCHIMSRYSVQRSEREMILNDIQGCQIKRVRIGTGIASTLETTDVITDALTNNVYGCQLGYTSSWNEPDHLLVRRKEQKSHDKYWHTQQIFFSLYLRPKRDRRISMKPCICTECGWTIQLPTI